MKKHTLPDSLMPGHLQRQMSVPKTVVASYPSIDTPAYASPKPAGRAMFAGKASNELPASLVPPGRMQDRQARPQTFISPTLSDNQLIKAYQRELGERGIIPRTIRDYASYISHFAGFLATQNKTLKEATYEDTQAYTAFLQREKTLPGFRTPHINSAGFRLTALRGFYRFLAHERVLPASPFIDARKTGNREEVVVLSPEQIQTLESAIANRPFAPRLHAFFNFLLKTGIGPEEVAFLQRADVESSRAQMKITNKNGNTRVLENLHPEAIAAFNASQERINPDNPYAFPQLRPRNSTQPVSAAVVHSAISDLGVAAGVHCTAGMLRDTFAVEALGNKRAPQSIAHDMGLPIVQFNKRYEAHIS